MILPVNSVAIKVTGLGKTYLDANGDAVVACQNIDFEVSFGEIFGLLGTNGAGKTTILRILSTVLLPTAGAALIDGYNTVTHAEHVRRSIGFLSSTTGIYGRLTAREMISFFGRLYSMSEDQIAKRTDEISRDLEMQEFLDRRCDKLSSGQKQRVNIARTIIHDPTILIFDEPTTGLDILSATQIVKFLQASKEQGKCVIFSTHIMSEVERLCDKILILHHGSIRTQGELASIRDECQLQNLEDIFLHSIGQLQ